MNKQEKILVFGGILILIIGILIYLNFINSNKPECYFAEENKCMIGYDKVSLQYPQEGGFTYECCKKPHYVLQGLEMQLWNHVSGTYQDEIKECMFNSQNTVSTQEKKE